MKSKGKQAGKKPVVNAGKRRELHVAECLVWPDPNAAPVSSADHSQQRVIQPKPELGRPLNRGYTRPAEKVDVECAADRDTAIKALRGWPHTQQHQPQANEFEDFMNGYGISGAPMSEPYQDYETQQTKHQAGKKEKNKKKGKTNKREGEPHISDLVSHRFMYEAVMERQRKEQERNQEEAEASRAMRSRRYPSDVKANKTSQLRSIAMAEKVERSTSDLWQMPKFKDNAKPALDTRRRRKSTQNRGGNKLEEALPTCTCSEEQTGYRGADYERYLQRTPVDYKDTDGAHLIPSSPPQAESINGDIMAL